MPLAQATQTLVSAHTLCCQYTSTEIFFPVPQKTMATLRLMSYGVNASCTDHYRFFNPQSGLATELCFFRISLGISYLHVVARLMENGKGI